MIRLSGALRRHGSLGRIEESRLVIWPIALISKRLFINTFSANLPTASACAHSAPGLTMHCKITQKISRDPDLLDKARENLERWSAKSVEPLPQYLHEWQEILKRPWPEIAEIITSLSTLFTLAQKSLAMMKSSSSAARPYWASFVTSCNGRRRSMSSVPSRCYPSDQQISDTLH